MFGLDFARVIGAASLSVWKATSEGSFNIFQLDLWNTSKNYEKLWKTWNNRMNGTNHRKGVTSMEQMKVWKVFNDMEKWLPLEANDPGSKNIELLSNLQTYLLYSTLNCGNLWNCEHLTTVS
jgi:hypothetical protein